MKMLSMLPRRWSIIKSGDLSISLSNGIQELNVIGTFKPRELASYCRRCESKRITMVVFGNDIVITPTSVGDFESNDDVYEQCITFTYEGVK